MSQYTRKFQSLLDGKDIKYYTDQIDYTMQSQNDRVQAIEEILQDNEYFIKYFDPDRTPKPHFNIFPINEPNSPYSTLSENDQVCRALEQMANYILYTPQEKVNRNSLEFNYYTNNKLKTIEHKTNSTDKMQEDITARTDGSDEEADAIDVYDLIASKEDNQVERSKKNYKKQIKQRITAEDYDDPELKDMNDYKVLADFMRDRLVKIEFLVNEPDRLSELGNLTSFRDYMVENASSVLKNNFLSVQNFTKQLDKLDEKIKRYEFFLDYISNNREEVEGYKKYKNIFKKHSGFIKTDSIIYKDSTKGTIYFKHVMPDNTKIDYDQFDMFDKEQVKSLLKVSPRSISSDLGILIYDLNTIVGKLDLNIIESQVLELYRDGDNTQQAIAEMLGGTQQYVSAVFNKICNKIIDKYEEVYEDWYYLNVIRGKYKKCSTCGQIKILNNRYYNKWTLSKDGFRATCKECRKKNGV